jgi:hypothetical protein
VARRRSRSLRIGGTKQKAALRRRHRRVQPVVARSSDTAVEGPILADKINRMSPPQSERCRLGFQVSDSTPLVRALVGFFAKRPSRSSAAALRKRPRPI